VNAHENVHLCFHFLFFSFLILHCLVMTLAEAVQQAWQYHQAGQLQEAEWRYRQVLEAAPSHADAWYLLGAACQVQGKVDAAIECYQQALRIRPDNADVHSNLGVAYKEQGRLADAVASCREALRLNPSFPEAHNHLGLALADQGQVDEAAKCYREALRLQPDFAEAHYNLGKVLQEQGKLDEAVACYRRALDLRPQYADAHNNLGAALSSQGLLDEAALCLRRALALDPAHSYAHYNLGNVLKAQERLEEAVACYRRALERRPAYAEALHNLGAALDAQGKPDEAISILREAIRLSPANADAYCNLGAALRSLGRLDEAEACFAEAVRARPDHAAAHLNLALAWLQQGRYADGWTEYEWRWKHKHRLRPYPQPLWDGSPLSGKTILLYAEQGLGDTIQFIRYASLVKKRGGRVTVECQPPLLRLLETCEGVDVLLPRGAPLPAFDVYLPLLSAPRVFGTTLTTVPAGIPYLNADDGLVEQWRQQLEAATEVRGGLRIGIAWQGNPKFGQDRRRSIPLASFAPLARLPGVTLVSMQKGFGVEQLRELGIDFPLVVWGDRLDRESGPFMDTAALMKSLDLIISCDTAIAHLAGALGVPLWMALARVPHWIWLLERNDSPWYPNARLFRQSEHGSWNEVFEQMTTELRTASKDRDHSTNLVRQFQ
jgi:tetratricopeptide (TPR) repeat protein